ncbi:17166_t:CDS:1 [Cetraspora pellucida]|uniref:17166_t:CDS:1 n=1 Tax=Cetraspora pellucida TaxID=1433469 RepID=A0ACA9K9S4_9GLOM|nr:17166_t:CDS:1 [Cetraspora pellucida]
MYRYIKDLISSSSSTKRVTLKYIYHLNQGKQCFSTTTPSNPSNTLQKSINTNLINYNCKCLECSIPSFEKNSSYIYNKDKQNLILQVCKKILCGIQMEHNRAELLYDRKPMLHDQISNYQDVKNHINQEFKDLINSNKLFYEKYDGTAKRPNKLIFHWTLYIEELLGKLFKISSKWYLPFTEYLRYRHKEQIYKWSIHNDVSVQEHRLKSLLLKNLSTYLPGFKYLYSFEWNYVLNKRLYGQGDFIFASDFGVFCVVEVKHLKTITGSNARRARNMARKVVGLQALKYKMFALKKYENQQLTVISAIFY